MTGSFDAGVQPYGTQISATSSDDDTHIRVSWEDARGWITSSEIPKLVGYSAGAQDYDGSEQLGGVDVRHQRTSSRSGIDCQIV